ncbi:hypothetical protein SUGI_0709920 [Cryptomeria japonica]|uniref:GDSL esterase/lipase At4g10955 n=1 Tax=Cryptomeria japonica TaxID=3369 RepID=UPI002414C6A5|nr:GDSL esterase/lipase At4g10955 [Cryptomeria japonica]GLJ35281.1 hypothetical protein SUGI_0709920 [Cryptomeria japonica]
MASERQIFKLSGPRHLTTVDWSDPDHSRCVAASLVQGVVVQERDRQENRQGTDAQAEIWWSFFKFKLIQPLYDSADGSIFGSVYKWSKKAAGLSLRPAGAPKIVVAFRGTVKTRGSLARDLCHDLQILTNRLHTTARFHTAFEAVKTSVDKYGSENVWIAGHSLGAAMGILAGRKMVEEKGLFVQAHLFNPPFISSPLEKINNEKIKRGLNFAGNLVKAGLAMVLQDKHAQIEAQRTFSVLHRWVPCLYVNAKDDLCSGYVGYFRNLTAMQQSGASDIVGLAPQQPIWVMVVSAFGKEAKAGHLIPSARLTVNLSPGSDFQAVHGIHQWWAPDIRIECTEFRLGAEKTSGGLLTGQRKFAIA